MSEDKLPLTADDAIALVGGLHYFDVLLPDRQVHHPRFGIRFDIANDDRLIPGDKDAETWATEITPPEREALIVLAYEALRQARRRERQPEPVGAFYWGRT